MAQRLADCLRPRCAGRRHRRGRIRRSAEGEAAAAHPVLGEIRLPGLRLHHRRDRAAAVLVQQPASAPARPATAWAQADLRRRPGRPRQGQDPAQGRRRALGQGALALLHPDPAGAGRHYRLPLDDALVGTAGGGAGGDPVRLGRRERSSSPMTTAPRTYEVNKPFEGVIPNLERRWRETDSAWVREESARYQSEPPARSATASG